MSFRQWCHFATLRSCVAVAGGHSVEILTELTFIIEMVESLVKSCAMFDLLFVNIQCTAACSNEKLNFKVQIAVSVKLQYISVLFQ